LAIWIFRKWGASPSSGFKNRLNELNNPENRFPALNSKRQNPVKRPMEVTKKPKIKVFDQGFPNVLSDPGAEYGSEDYYYQQAVLDYNQGSCNAQDYHNQFESGNFISYDSPR
jgi:hypothetical protein